MYDNAEKSSKKNMDVKMKQVLEKLDEGYELYGGESLRWHPSHRKDGRDILSKLHSGSYSTLNSSL